MMMSSIMTSPIRVKRCLNKQRTVVPKFLVIGQGTKIKAKKIEGGGQINPPLCLLGSIVTKTDIFLTLTIQF